MPNIGDQARDPLDVASVMMEHSSMLKVELLAIPACKPSWEVQWRNSRTLEGIEIWPCKVMGEIGGQTLLEVGHKCLS